MNAVNSTYRMKFNYKFQQYFLKFNKKTTKYFDIV